MARILITGCSGFLAPYLIGALQGDGPHAITGITEETDFLSGECRIFHLDIRDRAPVRQIIADIKPDFIFHLAAISNVGFSWTHQKLTYEVNFIGSLNILEAAAAFCPQARVLLMSSAEIYGAHPQKLNEDTRPKARNPYSLSKYAMELLGDLFGETKNLDVVRIRCFNFTGPRQAPQFVCSDFASQIADIQRGKREPVMRVGNLSAVRDFSDVRDIARYLSVIARQGERGAVYNLCSGKSYSIRQILDILLGFSEKQIEVKVDPQKFRPVDIPVLAGDCTLIRQKFKLAPRYTIEQTLQDLLDYWRKR